MTCLIQVPHCWMTFVTLTMKLFTTLQVIQNSSDFSRCFLSACQLCLRCPHTLSPSGSPRESSPAGSDQKSRAAMDWQSSSRLIGHLESIEECGRNSEVVHHPVETQLCWCQNPSASLMPEWSISEAFRSIGVHSVNQWPPSFSKKYGPKIPFFPSAHHTIIFFYTQLFFNRFTRLLFNGPKPGVLLIHMPTQMEVRLIAEEKTVQKLRVFLYMLAYRLAKLVAFSLVGLSSHLNNLYFVGKQ